LSLDPILNRLLEVAASFVAGLSDTFYRNLREQCVSEFDATGTGILDIDRYRIHLRRSAIGGSNRE